MNSPAKIEANARYRAKTYKRYKFQFQNERDADIIESIQEAKEHGLSLREWLRELYENAE